MRCLVWEWLHHRREEPLSPGLAERVNEAARRIDRVAAELDTALADVRQTRRGNDDRDT